MNPWMAILFGWAAMAVAMTIIWIVQRLRNDAGIVDVMWAAGIGALTLFFVAVADGAPQRRFLIAVIAGLWAFRLAGYLLQRVLRMPEDGRYKSMRERWGDRAQLYLFVFFQIQATWSVIFAVPMLIAARNPAPFPAWYDVVAVLIWLAAVGGESIADRQLARFRNDPLNKGQVCQVGLWRYSRHPNYFFEWVHWWAYVLLALSSPWAWVTLIGPATMLFFLLKVTGVPPTEAQALLSRGDAYRRYQRTTSVFFPWPPRAEPKA